MAKVEPPLLILPKKRNGKKQIPVASHVDHIITVQGADTDMPSKLKNGLSPVSEHVVNGIIHSTMEGLKSNMKINLPVINDVKNEDCCEHDTDETQNKAQESQRNGYQALSYVHSSREIVDLSPIYENSSDGYSSHGDLRDATTDYQKGSVALNSENYLSSSATPSSLTHTHSENSFEMGPLTDNQKTASSKRKKRVNIVPEIIENDNMDTEITALRAGSEESISQDCSISDRRDGCLTMTGTIKRGKKKGQNVDVKLNISREELEIIEAAIVADEYNKMDISKCSLYNGPHILLFTLICLPLVTFVSAVYSFYMSTLVWYNIFNHVTEHTCCRKTLWAPLLILSYPFLVVVLTVGLGLYAGVVQVTCSGANWWKDICDFEKGFFGWLCNVLGLSECSPYEVVILVDILPA